MEKKQNDPVDTQVVELIGKHHLTAELLLAGLEVAMPVRDRGVDFIAYDERGDEFVACPIQMKAAMKRSFDLSKKYEGMRSLLIAYVWNLEKENHEPTTYALTYEEAYAVAQEMGYTRTPSWVNNGRYVNTSPGKRLTALLESYRMTSEIWRAKVAGILDYEGREKEKAKGWALYNNNGTPEERAKGLMMVIQAHFFRNPKAPSLAVYASHWLWASQGDHDSEVMNLLISRYPLPSVPRIQRGYSDWDSYGDPLYKLSR
jgi:hypothetical protein